MIIGIDLATVNCGLCFMEEDQSCTLNTVGMLDLQPESVIKFAKALGKIVADQVVYVDFSFNEVFLPGKKKHLAVKYFLAGIIQAKAKEANFITHSDLRKYYGYSPKMKKYALHCELFTSEWMKKYDEHQRDAYLLALMGITQKGN